VGAVGREELEAVIVRLLAARDPGRTICPSDAARAAYDGADGPEGWRALMQPVRETAYAMADDGRLEVTQSGRVVEGRTARGAIRLRLPRP